MVFINRFKRVIILCFVFLLGFNFIAAPKKAMAGGEVVEIPYYLYLLALAMAADCGVVATNKADINAIGMKGGAYLKSQEILNNADFTKVDIGNGSINSMSVEDGYALRQAKQAEDVQSFYKVGKNAVTGFCDFISGVVAAVKADYTLPGKSTAINVNNCTWYASWGKTYTFFVPYARGIGLQIGSGIFYNFTASGVFTIYFTDSHVQIKYFDGTQNIDKWKPLSSFSNSWLTGIVCSDYTGMTTSGIGDSVSTVFNGTTMVPTNAIDNYTDVVGVSGSSYIALSPTDTMIAGGVGLNDTISTTNPLSTVFPSATSFSDIKGLVSTGSGAEVISNTGTDSMATNTNSTFFDWLLDILKQALGWFGELLKSILQGLFVPSDTYLESRVMSIKSSLQKKLPYEDYTKLFHEGYAAKGLDDIKVTIYGQTVTIVKVTTFEKFRDICNAIIMAFVFFMLAIYNYNNIYKLIRGSDYVSTKKTFGNMIGNNDSKGVNE